eukprot:scaffold298073_cov23-Prasinocladus_malaysianus.AAC.1
MGDRADLCGRLREEDERPEGVGPRAEGLTKGQPNLTGQEIDHRPRDQHGNALLDEHHQQAVPRPEDHALKDSPWGKHEVTTTTSPPGSYMGNGLRWLLSKLSRA